MIRLPLFVFAIALVAGGRTPAAADPPPDQDRDSRSHDHHDHHDDDDDWDDWDDDSDEDVDEAAEEAEKAARKAAREIEKAARKAAKKAAREAARAHRHRSRHRGERSGAGDGDDDTVEIIIETEGKDGGDRRRHRVRLDSDEAREYVERAERVVVPGPGNVPVVVMPTPPTPPSPGRQAGPWRSGVPMGDRARLSNDLSTTRRANGPVRFSLTVVHGDIEVVPGPANLVRMDVKGADAKAISIDGRGNRLDAEFDGSRVLKRGDVRLQLPVGSAVEIESVSGEVRVKGLNGDVEIESVSGEVEIAQANRVEVESVSGSVGISMVRGAVSVETVSGDVKVDTVPTPASRLEFSSTSGNLQWAGMCGRGCRIEAESLSGQVRLDLDSKSSFGLEYESFSGGFDDRMKTKVIATATNRWGPGKAYRTQYGSGEGRIECETHSGTLVLNRK